MSTTGNYHVMWDRPMTRVEVDQENARALSEDSGEFCEYGDSITEIRNVTGDADLAALVAEVSSNGFQPSVMSGHWTI